MVKRVVAEGLCSGRAGCRIMRLARATWWYEPGKAQERQEPLRVRVHELSWKYPRYGFRRITALLRQEGWQVGKRQVQRVRRLEGLRCPLAKDEEMATQSVIKRMQASFLKKMISRWWRCSGFLTTDQGMDFFIRKLKGGDYCMRSCRQTQREIPIKTVLVSVVE